ncbi:Molybdopterin biosynthesis protein MoeA [Croceitalea dokdonensis DOKDO 023]|uniref:Molybdopterin molybdenumtransferase n=1 Tax=Croceitalea dokdonensis DOKDO 023 TaxID=1300341 RepID=A0A0P7AYY5_9FLAO|nr:molybdopterin molybdotransferase MoeA [Croceitalea dokdonensis]KPM33455.1 Molybdopterin biosynthesis protein MoeA [Croceitalea dokdonensis DOKDO 023]
MITHQEALEKVLAHSQGFGTISISLEQANGCILAEQVMADRDFPPFDRVTKDGIAINFEAYHLGVRDVPIQEIAAAGSPQKTLLNATACIEVMTGAMLPKGTDTVIMYEHLNIKDGTASIIKEVKKGQNIHIKGSDEPKGSLVLAAGIKIGSAEIGVLASVGKAMVTVKKMPKACIVSTGDELVGVAEVPAPYQIRKSNSYTLQSALKEQGIPTNVVHINDDKANTVKQLKQLLLDYDVLLLSGGVSKGKYDYLPEAFDALGVKKVFHRVKQRPGKPFWFGRHETLATTIFAFPGNPASTFANYHIYFLPWLNQCTGLSTKQEIQVLLNNDFDNPTDLTRFARAKVSAVSGRLHAQLIAGNGSGDLTSLTKSNGLLRFEPQKNYGKGSQVPFIPTRKPFL